MNTCLPITSIQNTCICLSYSIPHSFAIDVALWISFMETYSADGARKERE
jgi:hypothetical protein